MQTDQTGENKTAEKSEGGEDAKKEEVIACINILPKHFFKELTNLYLHARKFCDIFLEDFKDRLACKKFVAAYTCTCLSLV